HAVHQPHPGPGTTPLQRHGPIAHKVGLGCHDGAPRAALGELVLGALPVIGVLDAGQDQTVHEAFDEGGLAGPHRAHYANVDAASGALGDVAEEIEFLHAVSPLNLHGTGLARRAGQYNSYSRRGGNITAECTALSGSGTALFRETRTARPARLSGPGQRAARGPRA